VPHLSTFVADAAKAASHGELCRVAEITVAVDRRA
jgi:hypothetical protein